MQATSTPHVLDSPSLVVEAVSQGDIARASGALLKLAAESDAHGLPAKFLQEAAIALQTGEWNRLSEPFVRHEFVGNDGRFLLLGPFTVRRLGRPATVLTAIYGEVIPLEPPTQLQEELEQLLGRLNQPVQKILPFRAIASCGAVCGEGGEAFLVPDGWRFAGSAAGPALNEVVEQRRRLTQSAFGCMRRIFEPESAELLIGPLAEDAPGLMNQHLEYQYHEAGHASGYGLQRKLKRKLLPTLHCKAVEEWRSDGIEFTLATRLLPPATAAHLIAANFCVRFGIDAQRAGGLELDVDVNAALLTFDRLVRAGSLAPRDRGFLSFKDPTCGGLVEAVRLHREEALQLTRSEGCIESETGIQALYESVSISNESRAMFREYVVEPCRGLFTQLQ